MAGSTKSCTSALAWRSESAKSAARQQRNPAFESNLPRRAAATFRRRCEPRFGERDQGSCTYIGSSGRRCGARRRLELHHIKPFALGGPAEAANLTLHCAAHNQLIAKDELLCAHLPP